MLMKWTSLLPLAMKRVCSKNIANYKKCVDRLYLSGKFGQTDMNERSSRSHVIFTITIERSDLGADNRHHVRMGKLHLVDLAVRT